VVERISRVGEAQVCTSIIVAAELRYGSAKKGSPRLARQLEAVLGALDVLPFAAPADTVYGEIRTRLEQTGKPIGGNDLLIRPWRSAIRLSRTTRGSSPVSTCFFAKIGCGRHDQP